MSLSQQKKRILGLFTLLCPDDPGLKWDNAVLIERQGHEQLVQGNCENAIRLYIKGIEDKRKILTSFINKNKLEKKTISLINSCFHLAAVCYSIGQYIVSEKYLRIIIETVELAKAEGISTKRFAPILKEVYTKMARVAPCVITFGNVHGSLEFSCIQ